MTEFELPPVVRRQVNRLPTWLTTKVPRDHRESDEAFRRRRRVVAGVSVLGSGFLGLALSTKPGSRSFYGATLGVAGTWLVGGFVSGPLHRGWIIGPDQGLRRPVVTPIATGVGAFAGFYAGALVARQIPPLNDALRDILRFADQGSPGLVLLTTLANGASEEIFFRGAMYAAIGEKHPVPLSTAVYTLSCVATRNPALVLAAGAMGTLFGLQRRASGGIQAPLLTHVTWATLMLRYMPPLFRQPEDSLVGAMRRALR
ncbi:MAG TPA: CPBP family intramembrane glutamic endopeptidase [Frankiaceae bacterium]|nr:CPBP family intramembrane glutamic endopeptidase [Frankiaceae bacterium]